MGTLRLGFFSIGVSDLLGASRKPVVGGGGGGVGVLCGP